MCKTDIFNNVSNVVTSLTEVDYSTMCQSGIKTREVVDARYLLIYFLHVSAGFDIAYIARHLNMTPQGIRQILSQFDLRRKQSGKFFEILFQKIKNSIETEQ